ncbi:hypothetical protein CIL05_06190 [Virgibacillus profundi]|uniref:PepSY domain-containing protein n=1 Tax=Virgibacillus profundi TaxID=2024555 RepID=A0A2A2IH45_9BACI|nr:PepSY domain-containing protein [Virgibacillus profundi]PAV30688.1 hypothetical protein CIL05_06190 [Virgibacillus profundi]PXY54860.1 hypothetical protein CIT14_06275 [Virgibacillus profundi]
MKKKTIIIIAAVAVAAALGWGIFQSGASTANSEFSSDEIRELVLSQYPGEITRLDFEKDINDAVYEVVVENNGKQYVIKMDGISGEVLDMQEKLISENKTKEEANNTENNNRKTDKKDDTNENSDVNNDQKGKNGEKSSNDGKIKDNNSNKDSSTNAVISKDKAKEIALKEFSGTIVELEQDENDGRLIYEIQIEDGEDEAEVEIDAYTGEVILVDIDLEDGD